MPILAFAGAAVSHVLWRFLKRRPEPPELPDLEIAPPAADESRSKELVSRFGEQAAQAILAGKVWVGATSEMVTEALGQPSDVEERVLGTKVTRVYKYWPIGKDRYAYTIRLENGLVVAWEDKWQLAFASEELDRK